MATSALRPQVIREDQFYWRDGLNSIPFESRWKSKSEVYSVVKKLAALLKGDSIEIIFGDSKYEARANVSRV